ncbi:glycosyltransferase family 2 protein [Ramlibacter sp. WS9]|uniref:glycosyltransferase family 2 protein n=1 Tax=Ramlibacter sp. WS9 TaxID=1882741 RepID=UPI00114228A5|nr:glycosyltransferase family 2 protein [Ramlibacter sp. WS9]ROZ66351.1 glycosyltransferase family 2 protein [Ramlibacter sp. WS9]
MSFLERVDVLILTWNEQANLARTLDALDRFPKIVVLDSGSTDSTLEIAARYPNVRVVMRAFDNHANQWNYGIAECGLAAEWVLALDADYVLTPDLVDEIALLETAPEVSGYRVNFRYCIHGQPLTGSLYPDVTVLYRRAHARYEQDGHTQRVHIRGDVSSLAARALHDDRKPMSSWLTAQDRYAALECRLLLSTPWARLSWRDRLRRMVLITPWLVPLYCLTIGGGLKDGRRGLVYAFQRGIAEAILSAKLVESGMDRRKNR